ncbi:hypothetical protein [Salidesulfovibrio onnuriiensis]|uniref:hypothetical protein n=1 Tax=Salidesulfovibrio onnuriiensis TaxID=2583823 RepID=UPI0011C73FC7|nr:hypothetical protein [Salidesulfovibrio onnuriiensis]
MSRFDEFADSLRAEVVSEMAETYFGARKNIDDMTEVLEQWARELRIWIPRLERAADKLHVLLLDERTMHDFYVALDVLPSCVPFPAGGERANLFDKLPFAFTARGRYAKCVLKAYWEFQRLVDEYLNGRYSSQPDEGGRKRLSVHYIRFKEMFEYVNKQIEKVNARMATGDTLRYLKQMDPEYTEKERVLEACVGESCALNVEAEYKPMELAGFELPEIQELPPVGRVRDEIKAFCRGVWERRGKEIQRLLSEIS